MEHAGITSDFLFAGLKDGYAQRRSSWQLKMAVSAMRDDCQITLQERSTRKWHTDWQKEPVVQQAALIIRLPSETDAVDAEKYLEAYFTQQSKGGED
jgi:hypothetical protein